MNTTELSSSLRSVISALHKGLRRQLYSVSSFSMTELETIRFLIRNDELLPTELAALTKIKTQSMSQILKKLEKDGVIQKTACKEDGRKTYISLTSFGKKMVEKTKDDKDQWLKKSIEKSLTNEEIELLKSALPLLNKLIQK